MSSKKGDSVKLECIAKGDQPIKMSWKKEETILNNAHSDRYEIFETITGDGIKSEMVIRSVDRSDSGLYLCIGENTYGRDERTNKLVVMETPSAPTNLQLRESWSRSASVSWTAPSSGNSPILGYIVQHWTESMSGENNRLQEEEVSSSQTSIMIKNLKPGCSYKLSVVAVNEVGRGSPSMGISFKTGEEEPSGAPLDVSVEGKGPSTIRVSWKAPPRDAWNGVLLGFYVGFKQLTEYQKSYSLRTVGALGGNHSYEYFLTGLTKGTEYGIIVKAYNKAGSGPESQELGTRTLSGTLPPPPKLYVFTVTLDSISITWKMPPETEVDQISGFSIYYRQNEHLTWTEIPVEIGKKDGGEIGKKDGGETGKKDGGEYVIKGLKDSTIYHLYATAISSYGPGDPSHLVTVKTKGSGEDLLIDRPYLGSPGGSGAPSDLVTHIAQDMVSFISLTASVVIVVIAAIISFVCIKKARLEAATPHPDFYATTIPRNSDGGVGDFTRR